jgi:hypothetical protein
MVILVIKHRSFRQTARNFLTIDHFLNSALQLNVFRLVTHLCGFLCPLRAGFLLPELRKTLQNCFY